jgi:hypothetical protein
MIRHEAVRVDGAAGYRSKVAQQREIKQEVAVVPEACGAVIPCLAMTSKRMDRSLR